MDGAFIGQERGLVNVDAVILDLPIFIISSQRIVAS
jgi:hypothetical protein